jgi:hypothetical protein
VDVSVFNVFWDSLWYVYGGIKTKKAFISLVFHIFCKRRNSWNKTTKILHHNIHTKRNLETNKITVELSPWSPAKNSNEPFFIAMVREQCLYSQNLWEFLFSLCIFVYIFYISFFILVLWHYTSWASPEYQHCNGCNGVIAFADVGVYWPLLFVAECYIFVFCNLLCNVLTSLYGQ